MTASTTEDQQATAIGRNKHCNIKARSIQGINAMRIPSFLLAAVLVLAVKAVSGRNFGRQYLHSAKDRHRLAAHNHLYSQHQYLYRTDSSSSIFPPPPPPLPPLPPRSKEARHHHRRLGTTSAYWTSTSLIGGAREEALLPQRGEGEQPYDILNPTPPVEEESTSILPTTAPSTEDDSRNPERSGGGTSKQAVPAFFQSKRSQDRYSWKRHMDAAKEQLDRLKDKTFTTFSASPSENSLRQQHIATATAAGNRIKRKVPMGFIRALGPALVAVFGTRNSNSLISFVSLYAWALVGSSVGFYLFLYFISIGHALGIFFPVAATLFRYCRQVTHISVPSVLHSVLVLVWAARLLVFLIWREYYSWPALHAKILRVNAALHQKLICWLLYSFLYVCMLAPCWFRLESDVAAGKAVGTAVVRSDWGLPTAVGIALQVVGLLIESVADWQKSRFKALHRMEWCNTGLWKYSTHPNYAGEWLFWLGTVTASMPAILGSSSAAVALVQCVVVLIGFLFLTAILTGATEKLEQKQMARYGSNPAFCEFAARTGVFGPRRRKPTDENFYFEPDSPPEEWI